jgi:hypothetical protein
MYAITITHIFKGSTPHKRTPVDCIIKHKLPAAIKTAKEAIRKYPSPSHQSLGYTLITVTDEEDKIIHGYVSYRDGHTKGLKVNNAT